MKDTESLSKSKSEELIPSDSTHDKISRKALEEMLMSLGRAVRKAVIVDLEARGAYPFDGDYVELDPVLDSLERFFGYNSAQLMIWRLTMRMGELPSDVNAV